MQGTGVNLMSVTPSSAGDSRPITPGSSQACPAPCMTPNSGTQQKSAPLLNVRGTTAPGLQCKPSLSWLTKVRAG